jgi:hypothetical protein
MSLRRGRVTGPDRDPLGITAAEHLRVGQVGGESVSFGLTRLWEAERHPPESGCYRSPRPRPLLVAYAAPQFGRELNGMARPLVQ